MNLYKFKNENEIKKYKGGFVIVNNRIFTNPTEEKIREAGYKELMEVELPEFNPDTEYIATTYADGDVITPVYEIKQFENPEDIEE